MLLVCACAIAGALSCALVVTLCARDTRPLVAQTEKQKGVSYAAWWSGRYAQPDADLALARLADTGANWIALIVTQYQDNISSTLIYSTTATPTDADLIHAIAQAQGLGLKVMLKPHVDLANDPGHWRGQIGQSFDAAQWNAWFAAYRAFIEHYAQLAQDHGADQFCVGTELRTTESREADWRAVIAGVRSHYAGPITYAANHGDETGLTWWDGVDTIGVDAYYALTNERDPTVEALKTAWQPHVATLAALSATWNKPVLFTEIGYRSLDGANQTPWDWHIEGAIDMQEQADAYQATFESVFDQPWFAGLYWWAWGTNPFQGGGCDSGYTPHVKPAEDVLRSWYGAPPRGARTTSPQPDDSRTTLVYTDARAAGWENWSWDATIDLSTPDPVYSGSFAISMTAQAWGALSLHYDDLDTSPYTWLQFHVRKTSTEQQLRVYVNDENDVERRYLSECLYTGGQAIAPQTWIRVRIPLADLDAEGQVIRRISIKNFADHPSSFWIDEMRWVAAKWPVYLPFVTRDGP
jgi:hypothetical protein